MGEIVESGGLWLAVPIALAAGLISFLSPCVLPLVPGYLGYVSGVAGGEERSRRKVVLGALLFILGFTAVFVTFNFLGAATAVFYYEWVDVLQRIGGAVIILLGFVFIGQVSFLQRTVKPAWRPRTGLVGAPLLGIVFALGWTPCLGPTMSAVFLLSSFDPARAVLLAVMFCIGLAVPFLLVALGFGWVGSSIGWVKRHIRVINIIGGVLLILMGLLLVTGIWNALMNDFQGVIGGFTTIL